MNQEAPRNNASQISGHVEHGSMVPPPGGNKGPRKATDPFAPGDMPVALLEFHSPTLGLVNMPATASARYIVWIIGALVLACLAGIVLFPLNKVVSVTGRMISTEPTVIVQSVESGVVRSLEARVGDYVHKGQVLARLDPTLSQVDIENLSAQMLSFQAEVARLKAEGAGQIYHADMNIAASIQQEAIFLKRQADYQAHMQDFDRRISGMETDLQTARANEAMYSSKLKVVEAVLQMRQREQKEEVGSRLSTLGAQDALMDVERILIAAQQTANGTQDRLDALKATRDGYVQSWKAEVYTQLVATQRRLDQIQSEYRKGRVRQKMIELRAPADGVVLTVAALSVGAVISPEIRVMTLVPTDSGLEIEAILAPKDSAYVEQGNHALIKFASFPYDEYGGAEGRVHVISADSFQPTDVVQGNIRAGVNVETLMKAGSAIFYRVRIKVDKYTLHGQPSFFHPGPGMPVVAEIDVGKRTIWQYLFGHVIAAVKNGMREPS